MFQTEVVEKIKHILCSIIPPPPPTPHTPENRAVYEIMWKNIEDTGR